MTQPASPVTLRYGPPNGILRNFSHLTLLLLVWYLCVTFVSANIQPLAPNARVTYLLTPNSTRSTWPFTLASSSSIRATNSLPSNIPPPPPQAAGYYPSNFQPVHLNGRNQFVDLLKSTFYGGTGLFQPVWTQSWTIGTWIYVESLAHPAHVNYTVLMSFSYSTNPTANQDFLIVIDNKGRIGIRPAQPDTAPEVDSFVWPSPFGSIFQTYKEWIHIGITYRLVGSSHTIFINGQASNSYQLGYMGTPTYATLGKSDLNIVTKDMQSFRGAFYGFAFWQEQLSISDMWLLAQPRSAKAVLGLTQFTWQSWASPPAVATSNLLTISTDFIWSQYQTLSFTSTALDLSLQTPNPATPSNVFGTSWSVTFWMRTSPPALASQIIWSFSNSTTNRELSLLLTTSGIQLNIPSGLILFFQHSNGYFYTSGTPLSQWNSFGIVCNGTSYISYLNGQLDGRSSPTIIPPQPFDRMYIGKSTPAGPGTLIASIFGFSIFPTIALAQSDLQALAEPLYVYFKIDAPRVVAPGATFRMTITPTSALSTTDITLTLSTTSDVNAGLPALYSLTFLARSFLPQTVSFTVPTDGNTFSIQFLNTNFVDIVKVPDIYCIRVVDATAEKVADISLTTFTAQQFLAASDYHLDLSQSAGNLPNALIQQGPSGIPGQNILMLNGTAASVLDLDGTMNTLPFTGIKDITSFSISVWMSVTGWDVSGTSPLFSTVTDNLNNNEVSLSFTNGLGNGLAWFTVKQGTTVICQVSSPAYSITLGYWYLITGVMGGGGCTIYINDSPSLPISDLPYTASVLPTWIVGGLVSRGIVRLGALNKTPTSFFNGSIATFDIFQRTLTQREITFLAANKPASLLPPLPTPRIIAIPDIFSARQLIDVEATCGVAWTFSTPVISNHASMVPGPSAIPGTAILFFSSEIYGIDLKLAGDTAGRSVWPNGKLGPSSPFSIGIWVSMITVSQGGATIFRAADSTGSSEILIRFDSTAKFLFTILTGGASKCTVGADFVPQGVGSLFSQWNHILAVYDVSGLVPACVLFINGKLVGYTSTITPFTTFVPTYVTLATRDSSQIGAMNGYIAEVGFWTRPLTRQEIFVLGTSPPASVIAPILPADLPSPAHVILASSDYDWEPQTQISYGVFSVDLLSDMEVPDSPSALQYFGISKTGMYSKLTDPRAADTGLPYVFPPIRSPSITISAWAQNSAITGCLFYAASGNSYISLAPQHAAPIGDFRFTVVNCDTNNANCQTVCALAPFTTAPLDPSVVFHFVAVVGDDGSCRLYVNGQLASRSAGGDITNAPNFGVRTMVPTIANVGACNVTADQTRFLGIFGQLTVWQRELSELEIAVLYREPPLNVRSLFVDVPHIYKPTIPEPVVEWIFAMPGVHTRFTNGIVTLLKSNASFIDLNAALDNQPSGKILPLIGGPSRSITFSFWIQILGSTPIILGSHVLECFTSGLTQGLIIQPTPDLAYQVFHSSAAVDANYTTSPNVFRLNVWHLLTVEFDVQALATKIFVNGGLVLFGGWPLGQGSIPQLAYRGSCYIGTFSSSGKGIDMNLGYISYHAIPLTSIDILTMYRNPPAPVSAQFALQSDDSTSYRILASAAAAISWPIDPLVSGTVAPVWSNGLLTFTPALYPKSYPLFAVGSNTSPFKNMIPSSTISNLLGGGMSINFWINFASATGQVRLFDCFPSADVTQNRFSLQVVSGFITLVTVFANQTTCSTQFTQYSITANALNKWKMFTVFITTTGAAFMYQDGSSASAPTSPLCTPIGSTSIITNSLLIPQFGGGVTQSSSSGGKGASNTPTSGFDTCWWGGWSINPPFVGFNGTLASVNYFTRLLMPSEIYQLSIDPPAVIAAARGALTLPTHYQWQFRLPSWATSNKAYTIVASEYGPGSYAKIITATQSINLASLYDRPGGNQYPTGSLGAYGLPTTITLWWRYDGYTSQPSGTIPAYFTIFDFSNGATPITGRMILKLMNAGTTRYDANQYYLQFEHYGAAPTVITLASQPGSIRKGAWSFIAVDVQAATKSNTRLYINGGLHASASSALNLPIPTTRMIVGENPDSPNSLAGNMAFPFSVVDITIFNATNFQIDYQYNLIPMPILNTNEVKSPDVILTRSATARYQCPARIAAKVTKSDMAWIPGRSPLSGMCSFVKPPLSGGARNYWDLLSQADNPNGYNLAKQWTTDPLQLTSNSDSPTGAGLTLSFYFVWHNLPQQGNVVVLFSCATSGTPSGPYANGVTLTFTRATAIKPTTQIDFTVYDAGGIANSFMSLSVKVANSLLPSYVPIHVAVVIGAVDSSYSSTSIWLNGKALNSTAQYDPTKQFIPYVTRDACYIGRSATPLTSINDEVPFEGTIGQFLMYNRGLTSFEMDQLATHPPPAYVTKTTVRSLVESSSGNTLNYVNRPLACPSINSNTMKHYSAFDMTAYSSVVSNVPSMQCQQPQFLSAVPVNSQGLLASTLLNCSSVTTSLPLGTSLSYIGPTQSEARLETNPLWIGVQSEYVRTPLDGVGIGVNVGGMISILTNSFEPAYHTTSPLYIFSYRLVIPATQILPVVFTLTNCVSPCPYFVVVTSPANSNAPLAVAVGYQQTLLQGTAVGDNTALIFSTDPNLQNYTISYYIPPPQPCLNIVCQHSGTCIPTASAIYSTTYTCQCTGLYTGPKCADDVPPPPAHPTAVLSAPQSVTDCDTLMLDGSQSYNLGPSSLHPKYIWNVVSVVTSKSVEIWNKSSTAYIQATADATFAAAPAGVLNSTYVFATTSIISLGGVKLIDNCTYTFTLGIINDIDASATVSTKVKKAALSSVGWTPSMTMKLPSVLKRSDPVTTTILLTPSLCLPLPADLVYTYTWQAVMMGSLYPPSTYYPSLITMPDSQRMTSSQASSFIVPAGFWRTGYTYTIVLNLILSSASGGAGGNRRRLLASQTVPLVTSATGLGVTSTAVIAKITNGDRTRANTDELIITADQSYDPDFPLSVGQSPLIGVTFMWSCRVSGGGGGIIGCALPVTVNLTRPSITIPPSTLSAGFSYIWSVNVTSIMDGRSSVSSSVNVTLTVPLTVSVPLVTILAPPTRINIDDELRVQATVVSETTTNPIAMSYVWSIRLDNSSLPAAVPPLPSLYDPTNLANGVGVNTSSLVLLSNRLVSGIYRLTVTVTDPFTIDPVSKLPVSGYANIVFRVNSKPQPGECHISATTTTSGGYYALLTPFSVVCSSWYSNTGDEPFTYQISYVTSEAVAAAAANAANTPVSYLQLTPESFAPTSVQFFLPAAGSFIIRATIKDQVGSEANVDLPLTVDTPIVVFDLLEYIRNLTEVELPPLVASGSTQSAMLLASRIGDLINGARVTMSSSGSGSGNSSSDSSSSSSSSDTDINAAAQDRLTLYNRECLIQLSLTWKQIMIQTHNIIDLASMNLIIQAMLPLTKYASSSTTTPPRYYSNDTLTVALQLIGDVITAADLSTMTHKILSISTTQDLGTILSQLFVECSSLDFIDHSLHTVLHIRQRDAVAGEEISLSTLNFIGFVSRSLVSAGTEVHLSNGQSVILTSKQMETYVAQLEQLNSTSIDTASYPLGTAEMDTRIITFASQWNQCRNKASLSQLTSIELTFPNGDPIDIGSLGSGITFTLPLPKNVSDPILQLIQDDQRRQYEERCGTSDGFIPTNVTEDELLSHFQCQFYNTTTHQYSSDGCTTLNATRVDPPGLGGGGGVLLTCQCTHLTEFAILYQEAQSRDRNDGCPATATSLGDSSYLIFLVLYALVGLAALIQLIRSIVFFGVKKYWLITIEHTLMFLMCLARSFNMAMYYTLYTKLSIFTQSLLSGIPYLFYPWIFTFVIVAWASVLAAASQGQHRKNLFKPYAVQFILGNSVVSLVIFFIFISMAMTNDLDTLTQLQRAGIGVTCAVEIGFAIFFVIYGGLLVHELTKTFVSKHALKLGLVAGSLASAFAISAALLAFSVAKPERYGEHFVAYNCVYFSLDLIGLLIVMGLFAKSISRGDGHSKTKEVSTSNHSNTNGSHRTNNTNNNGSKHTDTRASKNGKSQTGLTSNNGHSEKADIELGQRRGNESSIVAPPSMPIPRAFPGASSSEAMTPQQQQQHYTPPEEQMVPISPPQSPHHQLDVNDSSAMPDDDDDVPLPPPPQALQQLHQQSAPSPPPPPIPAKRSAPPPPIPSSSSSLHIDTPASPSMATKRLPPPMPPTIPSSPSLDHQQVHHGDVHLEDEQLREDDF